MEKHDVDSPWYKKCVQAGAEMFDALEEWCKRWKIGYQSKLFCVAVVAEV